MKYGSRPVKGASPRGNTSSGNTTGSSRSKTATARSSGSGDGRRERWREHSAARRAELVDAAVRAIGKHGADVGMGDIAAEAGVSKPVLYRHFEDKSDLYLAVGAWGTNLLMERIGPTLAEGGSPHERIRRVIDTYLSVIEQYPDLYRFVVRRTFADRAVDEDPVTTEKTLIANSLSRLLGQYTRLFGLDSGGVEPWSHGIVGMVQASGDWWLERQSMSRENLTDYLTQVIWFAIDGLLRSGGVVVDPDEPLEFDRALTVIPTEPADETDQDQHVRNDPGVS